MLASLTQLFTFDDLQVVSPQIYFSLYLFLPFISPKKWLWEGVGQSMGWERKEGAGEWLPLAGPQHGPADRVRTPGPGTHSGSSNQR